MKKGDWSVMKPTFFDTVFLRALVILVLLLLCHAFGACIVVVFQGSALG